MLKVFGLLFYLTTLAFLSFDSFNNPSSSLKYFYIDSRAFYNTFMMVQILCRFFNWQLLPERLIKLNNYLIFPFSGITFIGLALANGFTYPSFVFNNFFGLNLEIFKYFFYLSGFVFLANIKADWLKHSYHKVIYFGGIIFLTAFSLINFQQPELFKLLVKEDGLLENCQFVLFFAASLLSLLSSVIFGKRKQIFYCLAFLIFATGLFFLAGEEISWGQRIFDFQTPQSIGETNLQGESTLHNMKFFQTRIDYVFMLVGLWGCLSWIIVKKSLPGIFKKYELLFPHPLLFFYFFAVLRFYFLNKFVTFSYQLFTFERVGIGDWQEVIETLLAFGFLGFAVFVFESSRRKKFNSL